MTTPKPSFRMIHRLLIFCFLCLSAFAAEARAQQCDVILQSITDLRDPTFAASSLWSSAYGDKNLRDRFVGAALYDDTGDILFAGERFWEEEQDVSLTLVKMSRNGRVIWEKIYGDLGLKKILKVIRIGETFLVLAQRPDPKGKRDSIWVGLFDESGALRKQKTLIDPKLAMVARDVIFLSEGKEILVVANSLPVEEGGAFYSIFYKLGLDLKQTDKKALNIGLDNAIGALSVMENGNIAAGGIIMNREGRQAGWVLSLGPRLIINWQRQYTRGAAARFDAARSFKDKYIVLAGHSIPYYLQSDEVEPTNVGGWIMAVDQNNGERIWERFYKEEDFNLEGRDLHVFEDGRISAVMNAQRLKPMEGKGAATNIETAKAFVRIVSFNRRGALLESNGYFGTEMVRADAMLVGKAGERILYGESLMPYHLPSRSLVADQAWVNVAESIAPYHDPCVRQ